MWHSLLTQTTTPTLDFTQLGVASIICVLLFAIVLTLWRDNLKLRAECTASKDSQIALVDRIAPLLADAADLIRESTEQQRQIQSTEKMRGLETVVGQLQQTVADLSKRPT